MWGYSDQSTFPKAFVHFNAVTAQTTLLAAGANYKIAFITVSAPGVAASIATFRAVDNAPVVLRAVIPPGTTLVLPGWDSDDRSQAGSGQEGLEVTGSNAIDITVFYHPA